MGAVIKNRVYSNRHKTETSDFLIGNVGEWQRFYFEVQFSVEIQPDNTNLIYIDGDKWILSSGKNWADYGFKAGNSAGVKLRLREYDSAGNLIDDYSINLSKLIDNIQGDTLYMDASFYSDLGINTIPYNGQRFKTTECFIYSIQRPESAIIKYSHILNSEYDSDFIKSVIDGTESAFNCVGMDNAVLGLWNDIEHVGYRSGMSINNAKYKYLGTENWYFNFAFQFDFCISQLYDSLDNFTNIQQPSFFYDNETLTDNIRIEASPEQNNPNLQIKNDIKSTKQLGNVGWFNENFNGLETTLSLESISYFDPDTLDILESLSYSSDVRVRSVIAGVANLSVPETKCSLGFAWVTDDEEFISNKKTIHAENILLNTGGDYDSPLFFTKTTGTAPSPAVIEGFTAYGDAKMNVKDVLFYVDGSNLVYEATWTPSSELTTFIDNINESQRNYVLWVSTSDHTKDTNSSDLTTLLIDYNQLKEIIEPAGEWDGLSILYFAHPFDGSDDLNASDSNHFVEDDILVKSYFNVDINGVIPSLITFAVEAEKTNGEIFELDSYSVDLSQFPSNVNGIPQFDVDQIRGFKLGQGNNKNWVKVQRYSDNDIGTSAGYVSYFGLKIRYEDWISRANVPSDFFDNNELNKGFNNDWYHYLSTVGWNLNFVIYIQASVDGEAVQYKNKKTLIFSDYESNDDIDTTFVYKRHSDGQLIDSCILSEEITKVEVTQTIKNQTWGDLSNIYGLICLEQALGAGQFSFRQISTIWESENDNSLLSLQDDNLCKITLLSPTEILLEALIDPSRLDDAAQYKITSRIGAITTEECDYNVLTQEDENLYSQNGECILYQ